MSQKADIKRHLEIYGSITPLDALNRYGCMRLASRITDLKAEGLDIYTEMEENNGKKYARYYKGKPEPQKSWF